MRRDSMRDPRVLIGLPLMAMALVALLISWGLSSSGNIEATSGRGPEVAIAGSQAAMAVDCNAGTDGVQSNCTYEVGSFFDIAVHATDAGAGYSGHQVKVRWADPVLEYHAAASPSTESQWPDCDIPARFDNQPVDPSVFYGCISFPIITSTHEGSLVHFQMECEGADTTALTLVPPAGDPQGGSLFADAAGLPVVTALTSASVTCVSPTETPTVTDTPTHTATETATTTPTATHTPTVADTPTNTPTVTNTPTRTATATPTNTPPPTATDTPNHTATSTATRTVTATRTAAATRTPTATPLATSTGFFCPDVTGEGRVNRVDLWLVRLGAFLHQRLGIVIRKFDVNHDGRVDEADVDLVQQHMGAVCGDPLNRVPGGPP